MTEIKYVSQDALEVSLQMERQLQSFPAQAGIIFVSVKAIPELEGKVTTYEVRLGMSKTVGEAAGSALLNEALGDWVLLGVKINAAIYTGVPGGIGKPGNS